MRAFEQIFLDSLNAALREAFDEPVGECPWHGRITRAEDHVLKRCRQCYEGELRCQATAKPGS